jgi:hypothetical protein
MKRRDVFFLHKMDGRKNNILIFSPGNKKGSVAMDLFIPRWKLIFVDCSRSCFYIERKCLFDNFPWVICFCICSSFQRLFGQI